ncbi:uncharacterized protein LACBIDRAFT_321509 [Laccaria bicolor S238N-H82]|uniref:Predicted protein n=1 Tax=Laccaria bicolor (strain S238N-H82 / ATCC MYA-4686) TaxID=486041 RepID=B0CT46_LACBS|nr:uncharacterized protein LACBIDRAFT_321509 [Laccaria bicolor S238N-H82]EDR13873.1 predicted protein [Laccaria bicolor S238N-H82]|eukprot:XP_001874432.1 predicted protein [Laccaria bicolor S238N-H82]
MENVCPKRPGPTASIERSLVANVEHYEKLKLLRLRALDMASSFKLKPVYGFYDIQDIFRSSGAPPIFDPYTYIETRLQPKGLHAMASGIPDVNKIISSLAATKYTTVASATILMWDYVLTLDQEISRVWSAKRTVGTTIFLFVARFEKSHPVVNFNSCRNYEIVSTLMDLVSIAIIEGILCFVNLQSHFFSQGLTFHKCSMVNMVTIFFIVFRYETCFWVPFFLLETSKSLKDLVQPISIIVMSSKFSFLDSDDSISRWQVFTYFGELWLMVFYVGLIYYIVIMYPFASYLAVGQQYAPGCF